MYMFRTRGLFFRKIVVTVQLVYNICLNVQYTLVHQSMVVEITIKYVIRYATIKLFNLNITV